jgi:hypothetical protein
MARKDSTKTKPAVKGDQIRFIGGTYEGLNGWLNKSKKSKDGWVYVIVQEVDEVDGTPVNLHPARVQLFSIASPLVEPKNAAEAFLQYHTDVDKVLTNLAKKMVKCGVTQSDKPFHKDFQGIFLERITWAVNVQQKAGPKATYRRSPA